ncbi:MAG: DUF4430 domain-containing protein [Planctomycetes bacterium]|nr:DUF4430 domain-containing protein [Planctomycetota bacterium]
MRNAMLLVALALLFACATQDATTVTVEVRYPERLGLVSQPRRIMSVSEGATVEDATRQLLRTPWRSGLRADDVEFYTRMLLRTKDNDPRTAGHWAWSLNGAYPQTVASDWKLKPGDTIVWSYDR